MSAETHDSLEPGHRPWAWMSLNVGTALVLATVLALLTLLLPSGGENAAQPAYAAGDSAPEATVAPEAAEVTVTDQAAPSEPIAQSPPTTVAATEALFRGGEDAASAGGLPAAVLSLANEITNMGQTEVGFVSRFPVTDYTWERIEFDGEGQTDLAWLGELNGALAAVTSTWSEDWNNQTLVTYLSDDGLAWEASGRQPLADSSYLTRVVGDGERIYAFVGGEGYETVAGFSAYVTSDGATWSEMELDISTGDVDFVYVQNAAAGPAGLALAVSFESYPDEPPALLEFDDVQVSLDYRSNTYELLDAATGEELLSGPIDDIYNRGGGDGQPIYDPASGEVIVTIPYEVWERAYAGYYEGYGSGTPLPLPIRSEGSQTGPIVIEYEGFIVEVDERAGSYRVTDSSSGEEIAAGSVDYLYQGPPPRLVDPESDEVLLEVTWDEWYAAEEMGWRYVEGVGGDYTNRTELLTSNDGETWASTVLPGLQGSNVTGLLPTDDGFVALVNSYGDYGERGSTWTYTSGEWTSEGREHSQLWFNQVVKTPDGFVGVGEGAGGPALWSSPNGIDWTSEFAIVAQDDGSYAYLSDVATDDTGTVAALVQRDRWSDYRPLVMDADGYTLTFEDGETVLTVTDSSEAVVLSIGWDAFENGDGSDLVRWEDGITYIDLGNGDVVQIADDKAREAMETRWADQGQSGLSVFLEDDRGWSEAIVEVDGAAGGANQVYLFGGKIIIAGTVYAEEFGYYETEFAGGDGSFVVIVGTPAG